MSGALTLAGFGEMLAHFAAEMAMHEHEALDHAAKLIQRESKRVIGTYEYGWPRLAESTLARKSGDTPLLETGEMRQSIETDVQLHVAYVGTNDEKAAFHELGTQHEPPRSFLMEAAVRKEHEVVELLGKEALKGIVR